MKTLAAQFLVCVVVCVSLAFSQEDGEGRRLPKYAVVNKQINIREIIRFGWRRGEEGQEDTASFEIPEDNSNSWTSLSSLLTKASNAASLRKMKTMLPLSGLRWLDQTDNDPGKAVVCGPEGAHFNITWEPKVVDSQKSVKVDFDITNPIDFDKGQIHLELYQKGSSDPMFSLDQDMSCSQIAQVAPFVKCPLKKGNRLVHSLEYNKLKALKPGTYTIALKIFSYEGNPHPLFACLNFTVQLV